MFTGLIEEIGTVREIRKEKNFFVLSIQAKKVMDDMQLGDSISTNGVCLSVTHFTNRFFVADVIPETINRTNLKYLKSGDKVNIERAMKLSNRMGGHLVNGHIDDTGKIIKLRREKHATWMIIEASDLVLKYIVEKGSVAINGVSLTVVSIDEKAFSVSIIPHTKKETNLLLNKPMDIVNIECDILAKYIDKLLKKTAETSLNSVNQKKSKINWKFLEKNGFM